MHPFRSRRALLAGVVTLTALGVTVPGQAALDAIELQWADLVPVQEGLPFEAMEMLGIVEHGALSTGFEQDTAASVTTEYNGQTIRMPGYVVPLDFSATGVNEFLLVPYVGACIHVPPPPPNQIVFVTVDDAFEPEGLFEPVWVTGTFNTAAVSTELADIGYTIEADTIEPYEF